MKKSEIIHILKDPILETLEELSNSHPDKVQPNYASELIAYALWLYDENLTTEEDILAKNNPFALVDPDSGTITTFNSLKECIMESAISWKATCTLPDEMYRTICKANNLYRFDKEYLENHEEHIIDLDEEQSRPNVDIYTVSDDSGVVIQTNDLEEAREEKNKKVGRIINDSKGRIIDGHKTHFASKNIVYSDLRAGAMIKCENLNMYYKSMDKAPARTISGEFYLYDGREVNGRYAICVSPSVVGAPLSILGFVNAKDLKK